MDLLDRELELRMLRTVCDRRTTAKGAKLFGLMQREHFRDRNTRAVYRRLRIRARRSGKVPTWSALRHDPSLPAPARNLMDRYDFAKALPSKAGQEVWDDAFENLDKFRRVRELNTLREKLQDGLEGDEVDLDGLLDAATTSLTAARSSNRHKEPITIAGDDARNTADDLVEELLSGKRKPVVPTGFNAFDSRNGGIILGSLFVVAATTGAGKSALAVQLGINMARAGYKVCIVPLEMTEEEMMARVLANISGTDVREFIATKLEADPNAIRRAWREFRRSLKELGGELRLWAPDEDMTIEDILTVLNPYDDEVTIVDYIGLLGGSDDDSQWERLGDICRYGKNWARIRKKVLVLLAQLAEDGKVRYARSIREHANNVWQWRHNLIPGQEGKGHESGGKQILEVQQTKARNQEQFPFPVEADFAYMRMQDAEESMPDETEGDEGRSPKRERKVRREPRRRRPDEQDVDEYLEDIGG